MNCKNCNTELFSSAEYCHHCGAEIIEQRITFKRLVNEAFSESFGWDASFLKTTKALLVEPQQVVLSYINGIRKKYMNPFRYMLICLTISLIVLNLFLNQFMEGMYEVSSSTNSLFGGEAMSEEQAAFQEEFGKQYMEYLMKFYTLYMSLFIPVYTLWSWFSFPKKHNIGEHLVINSYAQGFLYLGSTLLFVLSIFINPSIYYISFFLMMAYYIYLFQRLYKLTVGQILISILKFLLFFILFAAFIFILGILIGIIYRLFWL